MVDALIRARRWLAPQGVVIDLRPADPVPDVEMGLPDGTVIHVGEPVVDDARRARHRAADEALRAVVGRHAFAVKDEEQFSFFYYPDSPEELRDYLATKWQQTRIDDRAFGQIVAAVRAHPGGRLWLRESVGIRTLRPG
jgi:hypothetical protein